VPRGYAPGPSCGSFWPSHLGNLPPKDLTASADVVDQLRAATDQCITRTDYGHVSLALFAPVLERIEQLRIQTRQASQVLKASISSVLRLFE
jgi:hypothetical protein